MIYIFKSCDACARWCSQTFGAACDPLCKVLDRPLGSYAFATGLVNLFSGLLAILALTSDDDCSSMKLFAVMNVAVSIIHAGFALYLQQKLVAGLQRNIAAGHHGSTARQLMQEAGDIVLYDVGFCVYVFFFVAAFFLQFWGFSVLGGCKDAGMAWGSATLQVLFCMGAVAFGFCWYCAMSCNGCFGLFSSGGPQQSSSGSRPGQQGPVGLTRLIVGGSSMAGPPPPSAGTTVLGAPVAQPFAASAAPSAPPAEAPRQQATAAEAGAAAAAGALNLAGKGLQAAGKLLAGDRRPGQPGGGR